MTYQLQVLEVTKYTTLLEVCQSDDLSVFPLPTMSVRLYHDARVAEVCSSEQLGRVQARYDYPNENMVQPDEKAQLNRFLGDWLTFCLKHGISRSPITLSQ
ncbi:dehydrogenase [Vibrio cholerae]|nr:dehydrogenase [Vibrio cholerae]